MAERAGARVYADGHAERDHPTTLSLPGRHDPKCFDALASLPEGAIAANRIVTRKHEVGTQIAPFEGGWDVVGMPLRAVGSAERTKQASMKLAEARQEGPS